MTEYRPTGCFLISLHIAGSAVFGIAAIALFLISVRLIAAGASFFLFDVALIVTATGSALLSVWLLVSCFQPDKEEEE